MAIAFIATSSVQWKLRDLIKSLLSIMIVGCNLESSIGGNSIWKCL